MRSYNFKEIEKKWQKRWAEEGLYKAEDFSGKPKFYCLVEFPYPSGAGLHVGHVRSYTALDAVSRKKRMEGYNVLYPIGWDAFGLPTENYAIKTKQHPRTVTEENVAIFRKQIKSLGLSFDWSREVNTTDSEYYKWTQWIFLQLFKKGLAYRAEIFINWCPSCKIGLANEEAIGWVCERCGAKTEKRLREQWMLKITAYAERLLSDLDSVDYSERIKTQQINWIGRSEGAEIKFPISNFQFSIDVFTTRPDTIFGATYLVLAPEHKLISHLTPHISNLKEVEDYIQHAGAERDVERTAEGREKTGVQLGGVTAINPANNEKIPVWIADYVLDSYGTGAIMAVPAHDERDFEFARKYKLPMRRVIRPDGLYKSYLYDDSFNENPEEFLKDFTHTKTGGGGYYVSFSEDKLEKYIDWIERYLKRDFWCEIVGERIIFIFGGGERITVNTFADEDCVFELCKKYYEKMRQNYCLLDMLWNCEFYRDFVCYIGEGVLVNSGEFGGMRSEGARERIVEWLAKNGSGERKTIYKLRDWVFSRQHYWGEPIPIMYCSSCGTVPVPEENLPVLLPDVEAYEPTDTGESPLAKIEEWVKARCLRCGGEARRETDTMPNWAGSSWYFLRYCDPHNTMALADEEKLEYWMPVDLYNGGMEHTTLHLLYSRFWHKFLYDIGVVPHPEPYAVRRSHGMVLGEDGQKMSKSRGNVVSPDIMIEACGADALRLYELFMGPFDQMIPWSTESIRGMRRFLERVWRLFLGQKIKDKGKRNEAVSDDLSRVLHKTIKKIKDDLDDLKFNTAISALMILLNALEEARDRAEEIDGETLGAFLKLLAPFAPHIADELWEQLGHTTSIHREAWPSYNPSFLREETFSLVVQVNGKHRATLVVPRGVDEARAHDIAVRDPHVQEFIRKASITRVIFVKDRLINFVVAK